MASSNSEANSPSLEHDRATSTQQDSEGVEQLEELWHLFTDLQLLPQNREASDQPISIPSDTAGLEAGSLKTGIQPEPLAEIAPGAVVAPDNQQEGPSPTIDSLQAEIDLNLLLPEPLFPEENTKMMVVSRSPVEERIASRSEPLLSEEESRMDFASPLQIEEEGPVIDNEQNAKSESEERPVADNERKANLETDSSPLEQLRQILLGPELLGSRYRIALLTQKLTRLEQQILDPTELTKLLLPLIAQLLRLKVTQSKEELVQAITPIVDTMIQQRFQQDAISMGIALANILPVAIAEEVKSSPEEIARALAPEIAPAIREQTRLNLEALSTALGPGMGAAIKEQIRLERDVMVDALYPVIGNTIAKYMAEFIRSINERLENALSAQRLQRKIRARLQGVSEAELIVTESLPFTVPAIFLIHKQSGLVIAEIQHGNPPLESDMVAGMLTAIRSFVNDCIARSGEMAELGAIDYGGSQILLEAAGYCYLAVVVNGIPSRAWMNTLRQSLSAIVQHHDQAIKAFDGDPATVPEQVPTLLQKLIAAPQREHSTKAPMTLIVLLTVVLSAILLPWGIVQYRRGVDQRIESATSLALASAPELAVYRLTAVMENGVLTLDGRVPNQFLQQRAEQIAREATPAKISLQNKILAVQVPPDPVLAAAEVLRTTAILNQVNGIALSANYEAGQVTVAGSANAATDLKKITQAFQQIPGVQSVVISVKAEFPTIATRIYFEHNSIQLKSADTTGKLLQVQRILQQHPQMRLRIIGYSDPTGNTAQNQQLAMQRATAIRDALVTRGIEAKRLQIAGVARSPTASNSKDQLWLDRYVEFVPIGH
jgi:outer membrane protein OmpA-like peptidoglycan-associated protein